ncbi:MAG: ABC transporter permease subunit, partial [Microthrixaceae bacterium]
MSEPTASERLGARFADLSVPARWLVALGSLGMLWAVAAVALPEGAPPGRVFSGAVFGAATALTAMGLILVYRANRIINFAAAAMGAVTGMIAIRFYLIWGWNYGLALLLGVVSGAIVGALVEVLVIRRFRNASRLILTVATIGLAQLLGGLELLLPGWVFGDESAVTLGGYQTPLDDFSFTIGVDVINGNHLLILAVVPMVVGLMVWFLRRSLAGTAVRASAENPDRVRLLGIPVRRLQSLVWSAAGALATLTLILQAPFSGTPPTAALGPAVLISALAAAVIARMESLPVACAAAIVLGSVDQVVRWNTTTPALTEVVLLGIILAALLLRRSGDSRAADGASAWQDTGAATPLDPQLRALPAVRVARAVGGVLLVGAVVLIPLVLSETDLFTLSVAGIWAIVAVSLVVLTGWNGQISLGQFAFVGVGAMVAGNLMSRWNVDFFIAMAAAAAAAALVALLLGIPALRIQGPFLAVVTLS